MSFFKVLITVSLLFSFLSADDIFSENPKEKPDDIISNKNENDIFSETSSKNGVNKVDKKSENNDYFDSLLQIEENRKIFEKLLADAKNKADNDYFKSSFSLLDEASRMNLDEKEVSRVRREIEKKKKVYLKEKALERRRIVEEEKKRQERIAKKRQEQINNAIILSSLNNTLQKQQKINEQSQKRLDRVLQKTYQQAHEQNNYHKKNTYRSTNSKNEKKYATLRSSNDYEKKEFIKKQELLNDKKKKEEDQRKRKQEIEEKRVQRELTEKREKERIESERRAYLTKMRNGISLYGKMCFGEASITVASVPKIKPKPVECIDVYYKATCRNNITQITTGVMHNLVDMGTGCYGDTKEVKPVLSCNPKDYIVTVTRVAKCPTVLD